MSTGTSSQRREVIAGIAVVGLTMLTGTLPAAAEQSAMKRTLTILHTNDMHSAFIGKAPAADYHPHKLNDDQTRGGHARLAGMVANHRARETTHHPAR